MKHCNYIYFTWTYTHEKWEDELIYQNIDSWDEVEGRLKNKEVIIFDNLSFKEKKVIIDQ